MENAVAFFGTNHLSDLSKNLTIFTDFTDAKSTLF